MFEGDQDLAQVVGYMQAHWPSKVKTEWQVKLDEYPMIVKKVLVEFVDDKTKERKMVRIAGVSGSGKTTQLLPAVEEYFRVNDWKPVLMAARRFVEYHPYHKAIEEYYGEENLRKMTDEFSTIMMALCMKGLMREGYDMILDVTLLDPAVESIFVKMLNDGGYDSILTMIAVSPEVAEQHLSGRKWRHTKETEEEFMRATKRAMSFYAEKMPKMRTIIWNAYEKNPVYDGPIKDSLEIFTKYSSETKIPSHDTEELKEAKKKYLIKNKP